MTMQFQAGPHGARAALLAVAMATLLGGRPAVAALPVTGAAQTPMPSLAPMVKRVSPAVVNIATRGTIKADPGHRNPLLDDPVFRRFFGVPQEREFHSAGSGVIVDARKGYIVTNLHVIENASEITVTLLDDRSFPARVVGSDPGIDIAVLQIKDSNLVAMALGDSANLEVGDFVVAIGNPFRLQNTVTAGIVSGLGRSGINPEGADAGSYEDFIQTDASINPGNSGGALVNLRGELVGINAAILSGSGGNIGIGFAIPVNMVRAVMGQLIQYGEVKRGILGISISNVRPDTTANSGRGGQGGALVGGIMPGSPAERAGVKVGDVITALNETAVRNAGELHNAIGMLRVGDKVQIRLLRAGAALTATALIAERGVTMAAGESISPGLAGAELADAADGAGVVVHSVQPASPAAQARLRTQDLIVGVGRTRVSNLRTFRAAANGGDVLLLNVRRGPQIFLIPIR